MADEKVKVVRAKTRFDRASATTAVMRLFENLPGAVTRAFKIQADTHRINKLVEAGKMLPQEARTLHAGNALQFQILKETILDRTVPTLSRVDMQAVMALLPAPVESRDAQVGSTERERKMEAFRRWCRRDIPLIDGRDGDKANGTHDS